MNNTNMFSNLQSESSSDDSSDEEIIVYRGVNPLATHIPLHQQAEATAEFLAKNTWGNSNLSEQNFPKKSSCF